MKRAIIVAICIQNTSGKGNRGGGMQRLVIFGGGFIGGYLFSRFSENRIDVIQFRSNDCNLLDIESIRQNYTVKKNDIIILSAAITRLVQNNDVSMRKNIDMAINLTNHISDSLVKPELFIFFSSVDVYGLLENENVITESLPLQPDDYYAMSKVVGEFIIKKKMKASGVPTAILRLSGVYGPGDSQKSTIGKMYDGLVTDGKIRIFDKGRDKRDFLYVDDIYKVIGHLIQQPKDSILNLASGTSYPVVEIARKIITCFGNKGKLEFAQSNSTHQTRRAKNMVYNITELKSRMDGISMTSIDDGLKEYVSDRKLKDTQ